MPEDSGRLLTPTSKRFQTAPDNAGRTYRPESGPESSGVVRGRLGSEYSRVIRSRTESSKVVQSLPELSEAFGAESESKSGCLSTLPITSSFIVEKMNCNPRDTWPPSSFPLRWCLSPGLFVEIIPHRTTHHVFLSFLQIPERSSYKTLSLSPSALLQTPFPLAIPGFLWSGSCYNCTPTDAIPFHTKCPLESKQ